MRDALAFEAPALAATWAARDESAPPLAQRLRPVIDRLLRATLQRLYPQSPLPPAPLPPAPQPNVPQPNLPQPD